MSRIKEVIIIAIFIFFSSPAYTTAQEPDRLIWDNDTLMIFSNPLEQHPLIEELRPKLFENHEYCVSTACWREYIAQWTIIDNELYLTGIFSCCYYQDRTKADLNKLFLDSSEDGKVKATWYSGDLWIQKGELVYYEHMGYESIYKTEIQVIVQAGKVKGINEFDNSKSIKSIFTENSDTLSNFIYSQINWDKFPDMEDKIKVFVSFVPDENGKPTNVRIMKGSTKKINKEVVRVIGLIPEWDVYYRRGKYYKVQWALPITFNEELREKYAH